MKTKSDMDNCSICKGARGGIPGNGIIVNGVVMCDYCHARLLKRNTFMLGEYLASELNKVGWRDLSKIYINRPQGISLLEMQNAFTLLLGMNLVEKSIDQNKNVVVIWKEIK